MRVLRHLGGERTHADLTDGQLLGKFSSQRDEAAFASLIERHGKMVMSVCRRLLNQEQDAEDAFQATFLVLARKAGSVRQYASAAGWLHGVARRAAWNARKIAMRRQKNEQPNDRQSTESPAAAASLKELQAILDDEVRRLADRYRTPFVLCCLEGMSKPEAAKELGWKEGTVSSRLARARALLQRRLTRRGVTLSAALGALAVTETSALASAEVIATTVRTASMVAAGGTAPGVVSTQVTYLAEGVMQAMQLTQLVKTLASIALLLVTLAAGYGVIAEVTADAGRGQGHAAVAVDIENGPTEPKDRAPDVRAPDLNPEQLAAKLAELERKGAKFSRDDNLPGKPIVQVDWTLFFGGRVAREDIKFLSTLPELRDLRLGGLNVTDDAAKEIAPMKNLRVLNLGGSKISDAGLTELAKLPRLEDLWLAGTAVSDDGLKTLVKIKTLKKVGLFNCNVGDAGILALKGLDTLEELQLANTRITDAGLKHLALFPNLHSIWLGNTKITDAGLKHLHQVRALKLLYLNETVVTNEGLNEIAKLAGLRTLNLAATPISDDGASKLTELKNLEFLNLCQTKVTDRALKSIIKLTEMIGLDLSYTMITDAGLAALADLKKLQSLLVNDSAVTKEGAEQLKKRLPNCRVYVR